MKINEVFNRWHQDEDTIWSQDQAMKLGVSILSFVEDEGDRLPPELAKTLKTAWKQLHEFSKYPDDEGDEQRRKDW